MLGSVMWIKADCPFAGDKCVEGSRQSVGFSGLARFGSFQEDGVCTGSEWRGEEET